MTKKQLVTSVTARNHKLLKSESGRQLSQHRQTDAPPRGRPRLPHRQEGPAMVKVRLPARRGWCPSERVHIYWSPPVV